MSYIQHEGIEEISKSCYSRSAEFGKHNAWYAGEVTGQSRHLAPFIGFELLKLINSHS
jgi:hypothetical protein